MMAMEISTSTTSYDRTNREMVCEERPIMPAKLFMAAIQGNSNFLVPLLGLPTEEQHQIKVTVEASEPNTEQIHQENKVVQYNLESTTASGETILHILVANRKNELAKKVFQIHASLLKAQNKKLQTPLHYAAKVGNVEVIQSLIQLAPDIVKDALIQTDNNKDTALHLAAKHGHKNVIGQLLQLNHEVQNTVNKEGQSPLHIAIVESQTSVVEYMLEVNNTLAFTQFSDGMFPIHVAARIGNTKLVKHILQKHSDSAELQDQHGRNFFHIAADENKYEVFKSEFNENDGMHVRMINAKDYDGNTPLHIAAMRGNRTIMRVIWQSSASNLSTEPNNKGMTPFDLSVVQLKDTIQDIQDKIKSHVSFLGRKFTWYWFDEIMKPSPYQYKWERSQLIGLGSVLITTVAFAAAFTVPGGYNADQGTPILGRRFMFRAFIFANTLAFLQAFASVFSLVGNALGDLDDYDLGFASNMFLSAANCMVLSFGTGSYVMLAPVSMPIAIVILIFALLFGSPTVFIIYIIPREFWKQMGISFSDWKVKLSAFVVSYVLPLVFIFCFALLN